MAVASSELPISIESFRNSWCINLTSNPLDDTLSEYFELDLGPGHTKQDGKAECFVPPSKPIEFRSTSMVEKKKGIVKRYIGLILKPVYRILRGRRRVSSKVEALDSSSYHIKAARRSSFDRDTEIHEAVLYCKRSNSTGK